MRCFGFSRWILVLAILAQSVQALAACPPSCTAAPPQYTVRDIGGVTSQEFVRLGQVRALWVDTATLRNYYSQLANLTDAQIYAWVEQSAGWISRDQLNHAAASQGVNTQIPVGNETTTG